MPKLTDSQLVILSAAAQRKDGALLPFPKSLKLNKGALTSVINSLLKQKLVSERLAARDEAHWREDKDRKLALLITDSGLKAVGADPDDPPAPAPAPAKSDSKKAKDKDAKSKKEKPAAERAAAPKGTKQALLIDLLKRKSGATIDEAVKATGWQAHSVRGAISGTLKKKLGVTVESKVVEGRGRVYQIAGGR